MTTKLRSACDRCHYSKVRCSGDLPCHGCLASKTLCFYSSSNALGRPKGNKKRTSDHSAGVSASKPTRRTSTGPSVIQRLSESADCQPAGEAGQGHSYDLCDPTTPSLLNTNSTSPIELLSPLEGSQIKDAHDITLTDNVDLNGVQPDMDEPLQDVSLYNILAIQHHLTPPMADFGDTHFSSHRGKQPLEPVPPKNGPYLAQNTSLKMAENAGTTNLLSRTMSDRPPRLSAQCTCHQQHIELLSRQQLPCGVDRSALEIDKALSLAKQGFRTWQNLVECSTCPYSNDQEVLLLTFISLRTAVRYLQGAVERITGDMGSPLTLKQDFANSGDCRLVLGSLEIDGEERAIIYRMLFNQVVQRLKHTLQSLQTVQDLKKAQLCQETANRANGSDDYLASSTLLFIQQITRWLAGILQALELSLKG